MELLQVRTGSRLHFGLMELAEGQPMRFGGLGMMLAHPQLQLAFANSLDRASADKELAATAGLPAEDRRMDEVRRLRPATKTAIECRVRVVERLPLHHGLGTGTQLAAATATGLELWHRLADHASDNCPTARTWHSLQATYGDITPRWLVQHAGRGLRSAIGLHGFVQGGLILDEGYPAAPIPSQPQRAIRTHSILPPAHWHIVLICPQVSHAVHGPREAELLAASGQQPNAAREQMFAVAQHIIQAGADEADFERFTQGLEEYMQLAGRVFARQQGGLYNGREVEKAAELAQSCGLRGVGQSSWGPTVFGFCADPEQAASCGRWLRTQQPGWNITLTQPARGGAQWWWQ